jgi:hypothetical protein
MDLELVVTQLPLPAQLAVTHMVGNQMSKVIQPRYFLGIMAYLKSGEIPLEILPAPLRSSHLRAAHHVDPDSSAARRSAAGQYL